MRLLLLAVPLTLALVLGACADGQETAAPATTPADGQGQAVSGPPADGEGCSAVTRVPVQGGEHLIGDQEPPVPYSTVPPTSGWHASGSFEVGVSDVDAPLSEPRQVSVLEAGGVVVTHRDLDDADRQALEDLATGPFDGRVALTPYEELTSGEVALAAWGVLQRCAGVDVDAITAFVEEHADEGPIEPGHD